MALANSSRDVLPPGCVTPVMLLVKKVPGTVIWQAPPPGHTWGTPSTSMWIIPAPASDGTIVTAKTSTRGVAYADSFPPLKFGNQSLRKATAEVNDANPTGWYKSRPIIWTRLPLRKLYGEFGF